MNDRTPVQQATSGGGHDAARLVTIINRHRFTLNAPVSAHTVAFVYERCDWCGCSIDHALSRGQDGACKGPLTITLESCYGSEVNAAQVPEAQTAAAPEVAETWPPAWVGWEATYGRIEGGPLFTESRFFVEVFVEGGHWFLVNTHLCANCGVYRPEYLGSRQECRSAFPQRRDHRGGEAPQAQAPRGTHP